MNTVKLPPRVREMGVSGATKAIVAPAYRLGVCDLAQTVGQLIEQHRRAPFDDFEAALEVEVRRLSGDQP